MKLKLGQKLSRSSSLSLAKAIIANAATTMRSKTQPFQPPDDELEFCLDEVDPDPVELLYPEALPLPVLEP